MQTYCPSVFNTVKNSMYGLVAGAIAWLIADWFFSWPVALAVGVLAAAFLIAAALLLDAARFTVEDGHLRVYRLGKLRQEFALATTQFTAPAPKEGAVDCRLTATPQEGGESTFDCAMLGRKQFCALLGALAAAGAQVGETAAQSNTENPIKASPKVPAEGTNNTAYNSAKEKTEEKTDSNGAGIAQGGTPLLPPEAPGPVAQQPPESLEASAPPTEQGRDATTLSQQLPAAQKQATAPAQEHKQV